LHAAGIYTDVGAECAADFVVSSYVPTLAALHRAQQAVRPMSAHSAALALVAADRPRDARLPTLHSVRDEIASVTAVAAAHGLAVHLAAPAATVADMRAALARAAVVHVACHGMQDRAAPLASAFALADGKLPVGTLASARADGAFLAFLSACETARGDRAQPDEAVHLVATLLAVGFTNVVGTMWCGFPTMVSVSALTSTTGR
jgi:CHAT domain-containing protein